MIKSAGWLIVFFGTAHTISALTLEGAWRHAGAWFRGELRTEDLSAMTPANSALWLSLESFGIPLILVGLTILWLDRRGLTPPPFIAWTLGIWALVDAIILTFTPWPIVLLTSVLLLTGIRRAARHGNPNTSRSA